MLAAAILAAGQSRRMGQPKALVPYQGTTFLEHLIQVAKHSRIGVTKIVIGARAETILSRLPMDPGSVVVNEEWQRGQLSSIQAAIRGLPHNKTEGLMIFPVDHPLVSSHLISTLIEAFDKSKKVIVLPTYQGRRGHPVIFRAELYAELLSASPAVGARQVVWAHPGEIAEVETHEEGVVLNLNDPESLERALGPLDGTN